MPDRIRWNLKHLASSLEVLLFLEDLVEEDVLEVHEYEAVTEKENNKLEAAKSVVRYLLKKRTEQVDKFLQIVEKYQPAVVEHVRETMRRRSESTGQQRSDRAAATSAGHHSEELRQHKISQHAPSTQSEGSHSSTNHSTSSSLAASSSTTPELPQMDSNFVGRADVVHELCSSMTASAVSKSKKGVVKVRSLVAPPGFGKTSIAIAVGHTCLKAGMMVVFVDLRGIGDVKSVHSLAMDRLQQSNQSAPRQTEKTTQSGDGPSEEKKSKPPTLVILDNAEDCMQTGEGLDFQLHDVVKSIISADGEVQVLLTSRILFVAGAAKFPLSQHNVGCLDPSAAKELLLDLCVTESVTDEQATEIVHHCRCVPLAIRIAAGLLLGKLYSPDILLKLFKKTGLDVFKDDTLKPSQRIIFLLEIAYKSLKSEEREVFHALSQFRSSFSSHAACKVALYPSGQSERALVHSVRFAPLIRICFLEYSSVTGRCSMQPFIAEFGRLECGQHEREEYVRHLSKYYLGYLTDLCKNRPFDVARSQELAFEVFNEHANIDCAMESSVLLSGEELVDFLPLATGYLMSAGTWMSRDSLLEKMLQCCEFQNPRDKAIVCLTASELALTCDPDPLILGKCSELMVSAAKILEDLDDSDYPQLDVQFCTAVIAMYSDVVNNVDSLSQASIDALTCTRVIAVRVYQDVQSSSTSDETKVCSRLIKYVCDLLLGEEVDVNKELEPSISILVQWAYGPSTKSWINRELHRFVIAVLALLSQASCENKQHTRISSSLLQSLGPVMCDWKRPPPPFSGEIRTSLDIAVSWLCRYFASATDSMHLASVRQLVRLIVRPITSHRPGYAMSIRFLQQLCDPKSSPYSIIAGGVSQYFKCKERSASEQERDGSISLVPDLKEAGNSTVLPCLLILSTLEYEQKMCRGTTAYSKDLHSSYKSLMAEFQCMLPPRFVRGLSVSNVVYDLEREFYEVNLLIAMHHQSQKVGGVSVEHHLELLDWWPVAQACFVCYTEDSVEVCPHCRLAWLCAEHRTSQYQQQHSENCGMLRAVLQARAAAMT